MSGSESEKVQSGGRVGYLELDKVSFHNNHLQGGRRKAPGCGVCSQGLAGALANTEEGPPLAGVPAEDEGDGADKKEDAPLPLSDWQPARQPPD